MDGGNSLEHAERERAVSALERELTRAARMTSDQKQIAEFLRTIDFGTDEGNNNNNDLVLDHASPMLQHHHHQQQQEDSHQHQHHQLYDNIQDEAEKEILDQYTNNDPFPTTTTTNDPGFPPHFVTAPPQLHMQQHQQFQLHQQQHQHQQMPQQQQYNYYHPEPSPPPPPPKNIVTLPDILAFSPEHAPIGKAIKIMISCSDPFPKLPHENPGFVWHVLAVFIEPHVDPYNQLTVFSQIKLSPVKMLNPYSCQTSLPQAILHPGPRRLFLVGVRLFSGAEAVCDAVAQAVVGAFQAAAQQANKLVYSPDDLEPGSTRQIQILTQVSEDCFQVEGKQEPPPEPPVKSATPTRVSSMLTKTFMDQQISAPAPTTATAETTGGTEWPANSSAMAVLAAALPDFPTPPVVPPPNARTNVPVSSPTKFSVSPSTLDPVVSSAMDTAPPVSLHDALPTVIINTRKRTAAAEESSSSSSWNNYPSSTQNWSEKIAPEVDRHCKIRFVEKLSTVIAEAEEGTDKPHYSWGLPTQAEEEKQTSNHDVIMGNTGDDDGLLHLDDNELGEMDEDNLDSLLDRLLIRIVESLVEITASNSELQQELNAPDRSGFALLHYASLYNLQSLIPVLLSRGANPDTPTVRGKLTPLHLACGAGHGAIVEALVRSGCAVQVRDSFGSLPADHANRNGYHDIASFLKEKTVNERILRENHHAAEVRRQRDAMELEETPSPTEPTIEVEQPEENKDPTEDSPPIDQSALSQFDQTNAKLLLQEAFSNLSLKDKLALNLVARKAAQEANHRRVNLRRASPRDVIEEASSENESNDLEEKTDGSPEKTEGSPEKSSSFLQSEKFQPENAANKERKGKRQHHKRKTAERERQDDDDNSEHSLAVASVISESDRESLDVAMRLMNQEVCVVFSFLFYFVSHY